MAWQALTATALIDGTSSMASGSTLNRELVSIPTSCHLTSYRIMFRLGQGASGSTYTDFPANSTYHNLAWLVGLSWVYTGDSVPSLASDPDNSAFLFADYFAPSEVRNTIDQSGSPAYADQFLWANVRRGRIQIPTDPGGALYFHIFNELSATTFTSWFVGARAAYNLVN